MSTLLEQASLVLIPSGYKEDVVYSQIPTSGAGDLSFTRASNGTRVNSAGLVEVCPWNMLSNSEEFTSANGWFANTAVSSTASQTSDYGVAPNGTTTADRIQLALNSGAYADWVIVPTTGIIVGQVYTYSIYIKSLSGTKTIGFFNDGATGDILTTVTTEWQRLTYTWTAFSTSIYPRFLLQNGTSTSADLLAWGYQLNIGSTAKPYFPTTDRLNVPRLTYQNGGGGCPSLLLEPQRTNVETWSEDFSNASWTKTNSSITANTTTSPDGTQNADKIIENSANGVHFVFNVGATISVAQTLSVYAKADTRTQLALQLGASSVIYNLSSGTIVSGSGGTITSVGNGWYRCAITTTPANTNALIFTANGGTNSYQGDGTSGLFIWGAQLELGAYPTTYIPTTTASATRVADACFKTGISSLIGQTSGTIFWDINFVADGTEQTINISDGTNFIYLQKYIDNKIYTGVYDGSFVGSITSPVLTSGRKKIAFGYILNSLILYINGVSIGTDLTSTIPTCDRLSLTVSNTGSIETNNFILFPTKLTNAELASLTTI
jgi:hypothetical protein